MRAFKYSRQGQSETRAPTTATVKNATAPPTRLQCDRSHRPAHKDEQHNKSSWLILLARIIYRWDRRYVNRYLLTRHASEKNPFHLMRYIPLQVHNYGGRPRRYVQVFSSQIIVRFVEEVLRLSPAPPGQTRFSSNIRLQRLTWPACLQLCQWPWKIENTTKTTA